MFNVQLNFVWEGMVRTSMVPCSRGLQSGYFLLGYEGEICASDSLVDCMEAARQSKSGRVSEGKMTHLSSFCT